VAQLSALKQRPPAQARLASALKVVLEAARPPWQPAVGAAAGLPA
jgi:hypothetical protein